MADAAADVEEDELDILDEPAGAAIGDVSYVSMRGDAAASRPRLFLGEPYTPPRPAKPRALSADPPPPFELNAVGDPL